VRQEKQHSVGDSKDDAKKKPNQYTAPSTHHLHAGLKQTHHVSASVSNPHTLSNFNTKDFNNYPF
jgi:hypothetical protein